MLYLTISRYERGALSACANSWALALTLAFRLLIVLKASLKLFLDLVLEFLIVPFACSHVAAPALRPSQWPFGANLAEEFEGVSPGSEALLYGSPVNDGNLSTGLVIDCEVDDAVAVTCNSGCRIEDRRPVPVTTVVVMLWPRSPV